MKQEVKVPENEKDYKRIVIEEKRYFEIDIVHESKNEFKKEIKILKLGMLEIIEMLKIRSNLGIKLLSWIVYK